MKNVEIITNIGWLLLMFFTRERRAEARYKTPKTEMTNTRKLNMIVLYPWNLKQILLFPYIEWILVCIYMVKTWYDDEWSRIRRSLEED